jgi:transcription antitermination factor NusA-like protein
MLFVHFYQIVYVLNTQLCQNQRYTETFIVSSDLAGRAIGKHGSNIRKARDIPGVSSVITVRGDDGGYTFYVHGEVNIT